MIQRLDLDFPKALVVSVAFHLVLVVIFALIHFGWMENVPEWVEMSFVTAQPAPGRPAPAERVEQTVQQPEVREEQPAASDQPQAVAQPERGKVDDVQIPKRRMLEDEEPELPQRTSGKLSPKEEARLVRPGEAYADRPTALPPVDRGGAMEKPDALSPQMGVGGKELPKLSEDLGGGIPVPFEIEGEAADRIILKKVIPEYPEGLQREAVVRLRFTVLANGLVGEVVPLQKADPTLERLSMDALRQWRFNPLDANEEQVSQQGIITFRYVLR
jgi:TonB family protein